LVQSSLVHFAVLLGSTAERPHYLSAAAARVVQSRNVEASPFRLAPGMMGRLDLLESAMEQEPVFVWVRVEFHEQQPVAQSLSFSLLHLTAP